ncbi:MAG TPA: hypothetical protein VLH18_00865 [Candidatus Limnocylindrales bacterium]|nr:hypothetical protein [Candidatus Limnocylindrales bacterium]
MEVHILTDSTRSPKQIVRDVESAVMVKLGIELDHRRISVAQLGPGALAPANANADFRLQFKSLNYIAENSTAAITITISAGEKSYIATANGPNVLQNRLKLVATATLTAVEECMQCKGRLFLGDVQKIALSGYDFIAAAVCLHLDHREEIMLGTAINKGDDLNSTARATLDAINRRLFTT